MICLIKSLIRSVVDQLTSDYDIPLLLTLWLGFEQTITRFIGTNRALGVAIGRLMAGFQWKQFGILYESEYSGAFLQVCSMHANEAIKHH
jgi:hypothetical protein